MKIKSDLKLVTLLLSCAFLFLSCKVYSSTSVAIDVAVMVSQKVKVKSDTNVICKFERLQKENDPLYGVVERKSKTGKKIIDLSIHSNSKLKIYFNESF
ncbi:MAG: hypothetical protein COB60_01025 [Flavobacteriaceae bacterium]|nr:MAG: hypothetical protein COB60_01025 [Flavobacteriaceae bacterium]